MNGVVGCTLINCMYHESMQNWSVIRRNNSDIVNRMATWYKVCYLAVLSSVTGAEKTNVEYRRLVLVTLLLLVVVLIVELLLGCDTVMWRHNDFWIFWFYRRRNTIHFVVIELLLLLLYSPLHPYMAGSITPKFEASKMVSALLFLQSGTDCILLLSSFFLWPRNESYIVYYQCHCLLCNWRSTRNLLMLVGPFTSCSASILMIVKRVVLVIFNKVSAVTFLLWASSSLLSFFCFSSGLKFENAFDDTQI